MSLVPIGGFVPAAPTGAQPVTPGEESTTADFGMALGLFITSQIPAPAPVLPIVVGEVATPDAGAESLASAAPLAGGALAPDPAPETRALLLRLAQALCAHPAENPDAAPLADAMGTPAGAAADETPLVRQERAARALNAAVDPVASELRIDRLARGPRESRPAAVPEPLDAASAPPAATVATAGAATVAASRAQPGGGPVRHEAAPAADAAPSAPREAPPAAMPPLAPTLDVVAGAPAAPGASAAAALPRDLTAALDAASVAPRRALAQVTLPFEADNGLEGRLRIALRGNALHATIITPDRDSAARIESALGELHRSLAERGFGEVRLAVQHGAAATEPERPRSESREGRENAQHKATRDDERAAHQQRRRNGRGQEG